MRFAVIAVFVLSVGFAWSARADSCPSLTSVQTTVDATCESCQDTSEDPAACSEKYTNSPYSRYCTDFADASTSWSEIWCQPPGVNGGIGSPDNGCTTAAPGLAALAGLALLFRRRKAVR